MEVSYLDEPDSHSIGSCSVAGLWFLLDMTTAFRSRIVRLAASYPSSSPERRSLLAVLLPSTFDVGDPVNVSLQGGCVEGYVRAVTFTQGKVRYAVRAQAVLGDEDSWTTLHNLDSMLVSGRDGVRLDTEMDNYS